MNVVEFLKIKNIVASRFSKSQGVSVTEDLSKRTREARQEMRKLVENILRLPLVLESGNQCFYPRFMRHVKKVNPEKRCFLQYDKLYIDGKVFMFNETSGKVDSRGAFFA